MKQGIVGNIMLKTPKCKQFIQLSRRNVNGLDDRNCDVWQFNSFGQKYANCLETFSVSRKTTPNKYG